MVGVTLSPEQIKSAPPEVRRWLEHQLALSFGLQEHTAERVQEPTPDAAPLVQALMVFAPQEAAAILALIQNMLPAVNVFFELGRRGESIGQEGIEAFRLVDVMRHARLQSLEQVGAGLQAINEAARQVRQDPNGSLFFIDPSGYCLIAMQTQQSIFRVWQEIVAQSNLRATPGPAAAHASADRAASPFFGLSGKVPASAAHMGGFAPAPAGSPETIDRSADLPPDQPLVAP